MYADEQAELPLIPLHETLSAAQRDFDRFAARTWEQLDASGLEVTIGRHEGRWYGFVAATRKIVGDFATEQRAREAVIAAKPAAPAVCPVCDDVEHWRMSCGKYAG